MPNRRPVLPYETTPRRAVDVISILARALMGLVLLLASGVVVFLTKLDADVASATTLSINIGIAVVLALGGALCGAHGICGLARRIPRR